MKPVLLVANRIYRSFSENWFRITFLVLATLVLIIVRSLLQSFGISLGYLYIILIYFAGIWFGIKGGLIMVFISLSVFLFEVSIFQNWPFRDLALKGAAIRLFIYAFVGLTVGYLSGRDQKVKEKLEKEAYYDGLTGCLNYRWLMHMLEKEINRASRYNLEMTIGIIDLDNFKEINDRYGHIYGNAMLKSFSHMLCQNTRNLDIVGRYGGDEFLLIFPETSIEQACRVMGRVQEQISRNRFTLPDLDENFSYFITFSAGLASYPYNGLTKEELIKASDKSLYTAKNMGRHRIIAEKRKFVRIQHPEELNIRISEKETSDEPKITLKLSNISRRGMSFFSHENIKRKKFKCFLRFPEDKEPAEVQCQVVHKEKENRDLYKIGVFFSEIPDKFDEKFSRYISEALS
ncbi:MAG: diguanylate cyclase [Spirochaetes bacterium]|nr:diguanylate cyclase [Spirochaetota bacterium]